MFPESLGRFREEDLLLVEDVMQQCRWPALPISYDQALHDAVRFIASHFVVTGIVASGTIIRGSSDPTSDLDILVFHQQSTRQRIQKYFNHVPAEIFVNPLSTMEQYFRREQTGGQPKMLHMLATGYILLALDSHVTDVQARAREL